MRKIVLVNQSSRVGQPDFTAMVAAVVQQAKKEFCPAWGLAPVSIEARAQVPKVVGDLEIIILQDEPDEDGALGYHTESGDKEWGLVFCNPVLDNGGAVLQGTDLTIPTVASVLSHEVLELLADPYVNAWIEGPKRKEGSLYALEVCDPVEADQYLVDAKTANGVKKVAVSNFILPTWGDTQAKGTTGFDRMGRLTAAFQMSPGGYMVVRGSADDGTEVFAAKRAAWRTKAKKAHPRSRRVRRIKGA